MVGLFLGTEGSSATSGHAKRKHGLVSVPVALDREEPTMSKSSVKPKSTTGTGGKQMESAKKVRVSRKERAVSAGAVQSNLVVASSPQSYPSRPAELSPLLMN